MASCFVRTMPFLQVYNANFSHFLVLTLKSSSWEERDANLALLQNWHWKWHCLIVNYAKKDQIWHIKFIWHIWPSYYKKTFFFTILVTYEWGDMKERLNRCVHIEDVRWAGANFSVNSQCTFSVHQRKIAQIEQQGVVVSRIESPQGLDLSISDYITSKSTVVLKKKLRPLFSEL